MGRLHDLKVATASVGVTLLVMAILFLAWRLYAAWRTGRIELTNEGSPLAVQVLSETGDEPVGEPFELAKRVVLSLPDGDYRLRLSGVGRLGRTYRFAVNRGETQSHRLSLDEGRLMSFWFPLIIHSDTLH